MSTVSQEEYYAKIPTPVVYHPDLTGNDVRVYALLSERAGSKRRAWPGVRRIAKDIGVSPTTVQGALDVLEDLKIIEVERTAGKVNQYHLPLLPTVPETDTPPSQKLTQGVPETGTELEPRTKKTSSNEDGAPLFEAFYEAWLWKPYSTGVLMPRTMRQRLNAAAKEARDAGIPPDEIRTRAKRYRKTWPKVELTPQALLANWDRFAEESEPTPFDPSKCEHPKDRRAVLDEATLCGACGVEL